jgi:hypothetical protein
VTGVSAVAVTLELESAGAVVEVDVSTLVGAGGAQPKVKVMTAAANRLETRVFTSRVS